MTQPYLFDEVLRGHGHVRVMVGAFFEQLSCDLLGAKRYRTDGTKDYCPDLGSSLSFFECKSAGRGNQTFIYVGRRLKDREFSLRHRLCYVIWNHSVETKEWPTVGLLESALASSIKGVYLCPFSAIDSICERLREEPLNSKYGKSKHTDQSLYGSGFRISLSLLSRWKVVYP